jgi:hypothetical protein
MTDILSRLKNAKHDEGENTQLDFPFRGAYRGLNVPGA